MRVDIIEHQSTTEEWYLVVREEGDDPLRRGYGCKISKREAFASKDSAWWRDHGNPEMAEREAKEWAKARTLEMAASAFAESAVDA
ncbi:MAG: hypothetical protein M3P26_07205 [Gemmatimonadota bacterium]|nr:hypothetical protein [Gemmatimonadota bacterium]